MNNYWSDYCIVCASSDCDIVVENEELKKESKQLEEVIDVYNDFKIALEKQVEYSTQLKEIIKTVFNYSESIHYIWKKSDYVIYTPEQKQIIIDILKDNEC